MGDSTCDKKNFAGKITVDWKGKKMKVRHYEEDDDEDFLSNWLNVHVGLYKVKCESLCIEKWESS